MVIPSYPVCTICTSDRESQPGGVQVPGSSDSTVADPPPTGCETIVFYAETAILQIESKEFLHVPRRRSPSRRHDARPLARRERRARRGRAAGARTPHRRLAEHAVPGAARRRADGAADARLGRGRRPARRAAAGDPAGARAQGHRRAARRADRRRRHRRRAGQAVLRDGGDRRVEPDGRRLAGAVRHRPRRAARPGVRARRGRGQTRGRSTGGPRAWKVSAARTGSTSGRSTAG